MCENLYTKQPKTDNYYLLVSEVGYLNWTGHFLTIFHKIRYSKVELGWKWESLTGLDSVLPAVTVYSKSDWICGISRKLKKVLFRNRGRQFLISSLCWSRRNKFRGGFSREVLESSIPKLIEMDIFDFTFTVLSAVSK